MPTPTQVSSVRSVAQTRNRHKLLKHQDAFLSGGKKAVEFLSKRSGLLALFLGGMLILAVGGAWWAGRREGRERAGANALFEAIKTLETEMGTVAAELAPPPQADLKKNNKKESAPPPPAGAEAIAYKRFDVDGKLGGALQKLEAVAKDYRGTRAGVEASLRGGDLHFRHGSAEKALEWYLRATEQARSGMERAFAWYSAGAAYENLNRWDEAVSAYEKAWASGERSLDGEIGLALGRAQEASGKKEAARATYDKILRESSGTEYARTAETLKARLN